MKYNNEYNHNYIDVNECTSRGACSISPTIASLEELSIIFLQHLAYYILKLNELGASNNEIQYEIIKVLASLVTVNEFSENQLFSIIQNEYFMLNNTKATYKKLCKEKNIHSKDLKNIEEFNSTTTLPKAIALGEKIFLQKYYKKTTEQKNLTEILYIVVKSVSINLIKLSDFENIDSNIYHEILITLNLLNNKKVTTTEILSRIKELSRYDKELQIRISDSLEKFFGKIAKTEVSHSTRKGKAILVSGNNFFDLMKILNETKDKDIDIYTHSNLLITHALQKFHEFPHLKGHYGDTTENCILDFATFPGSILLTKNARTNNEYLYRGRLFSSDYIVPNGVIKIENDDYTPVIETTLKAKGFSKGKTKDNTIIGYNEDEILEQFSQIIEKINSNSLNRLYIIGLDAHTELQKEYFNELFSKLQDNEFAISFGYESKKENVLTINIGNYVPLATNILKKLFAKYSITSDKLVFFFTTCDVMTISSIVMLSSLGAKKIYMAQCPPTLVNPSVYETFNKTFNINTTTTVKEDLQKIRNEKSTQ